MKKVLGTMVMFASLGFVGCFDDSVSNASNGYDVPEVQAAVASTGITVYYRADATWIATPTAVINMHYKKNNGSWTTVPGVAMTKITGQYEKWSGYASLTIADATSLTFCFNKDGQVWDSKNGANYSISAPGVYTVVNGVVAAYTAASGDIYYQHSNVYPESILGGFYVKLYKDGSSSVYVSKPFNYSSTKGTSVRFNDLPAGSYKAVCKELYQGTAYYGETSFTVAVGATSFPSGSMYLTVFNPNNITIYYKPTNSAWLTPYNGLFIHYNKGAGWTALPGVQMGIYGSVHDYWYGHAGAVIENASNLTFCFNWQGTQWDNNGGSNYSITSAGLYTVKNGVLKKLY